MFRNHDYKKIGKMSFPLYMEEMGPNLISVFTSYVEWLQQPKNAIYTISRLTDEHDIDLSVDAYLSQIRNTTILGFPQKLAADLKYLLKNVFYFWNAKSSIQSYDFLFRTLFGVSCKLFYPKKHILKASDGRFTTYGYLFLDDDFFINHADAFPDYIDYDTGEFYSLENTGVIVERDGLILNGTNIVGVSDSSICDLGKAFLVDVPILDFKEGDTVYLQNPTNGRKIVALIKTKVDYTTDQLQLTYDMDTSNGIIKAGTVVGVKYDNGYVRNFYSVVTVSPLLTEEKPITVKMYYVNSNRYIDTVLENGSVIDVPAQDNWTGSYGRTSSDMYLQSTKYNEFAYGITSPILVSEWKRLIKEIIHPAGLGLYAEYNSYDENSDGFEIPIKSYEGSEYNKYTDGDGNPIPLPEDSRAVNNLGNTNGTCHCKNCTNDHCKCTCGSDTSALLQWEQLKAWELVFKMWVMNARANIISIKNIRNTFVQVQNHSETLDRWTYYGQYNKNGFTDLTINNMVPLYNRNSQLVFTDDGTLIDPDMIDWTNERILDEYNNTLTDTLKYNIDSITLSIFSLHPEKYGVVKDDAYGVFFTPYETNPVYVYDKDKIFNNAYLKENTKEKTLSKTNQIVRYKKRFVKHSNDYRESILLFRTNYLKSPCNNIRLNATGNIIYYQLNETSVNVTNDIVFFDDLDSVRHNKFLDIYTLDVNGNIKMIHNGNSYYVMPKPLYTNDDPFPVDEDGKIHFYVKESLYIQRGEENLYSKTSKTGYTKLDVVVYESKSQSNYKLYSYNEGENTIYLLYDGSRFVEFTNMYYSIIVNDTSYRYFNSEYNSIIFDDSISSKAKEEFYKKALYTFEERYNEKNGEYYIYLDVVNETFSVYRFENKNIFVDEFSSNVEDLTYNPKTDYFPCKLTNADIIHIPANDSDAKSQLDKFYESYTDYFTIAKMYNFIDKVLSHQYPYDDYDMDAAEYKELEKYLQVYTDNLSYKLVIGNLTADQLNINKEDLTIKDRYGKETPYRESDIIKDYFTFCSSNSPFSTDIVEYLTYYSDYQDMGSGKFKDVNKATLSSLACSYGLYTTATSADEPKEQIKPWKELTLPDIIQTSSVFANKEGKYNYSKIPEDNIYAGYKLHRRDDIDYSIIRYHNIRGSFGVNETVVLNPYHDDVVQRLLVERENNYVYLANTTYNKFVNRENGDTKFAVTSNLVERNIRKYDIKSDNSLEEHTTDISDMYAVAKFDDRQTIYQNYYCKSAYDYIDLHIKNVSQYDKNCILVFLNGAITDAYRILNADTIRVSYNNDIKIQKSDVHKRTKPKDKKSVIEVYIMSPVSVGRKNVVEFNKEENSFSYYDQKLNPFVPSYRKLTDFHYIDCMDAQIIKIIDNLRFFNYLNTHKILFHTENIINHFNLSPVRYDTFDHRMYYGMYEMEEFDFESDNILMSGVSSYTYSPSINDEPEQVIKRNEPEKYPGTDKVHLFEKGDGNSWRSIEEFEALFEKNSCLVFDTESGKLVDRDIIDWVDYEFKDDNPNNTEIYKAVQLRSTKPAMSGTLYKIPNDNVVPVRLGDLNANIYFNFIRLGYSLDSEFTAHANGYVFKSDDEDIIPDNILVFVDGVNTKDFTIMNSHTLIVDDMISTEETKDISIWYYNPDFVRNHITVIHRNDITDTWSVSDGKTTKYTLSNILTFELNTSNVDRSNVFVMKDGCYYSDYTLGQRFYNGEYKSVVMLPVDIEYKTIELFIFEPMSECMVDDIIRNINGTFTINNLYNTNIGHNSIITQSL